MEEKKETSKNIDETKTVDIETVSIENTEKETDNNENKEQTDIIEQLNKQIIELNDKYLRVAAELENTRRRAALDVESISRNRAMSVAEKILPVMDAVQSALKHNPKDEGIQTMQRALQNAFAQIGITEIKSVGEILNPQFHNAIQIVDKPDEKTPTNTIIEEMQTGYMYGDTVLRNAMVVVSK